jgi:hypothetical protein
MSDLRVSRVRRFGYGCDTRVVAETKRKCFRRQSLAALAMLLTCSMHTRGLRFVAVALLACSIAPTAVFAQSAPAQDSSCGVQLPFATGDEVMLQQPADLGQNNEGVINYSAVRGAIVHLEGPLALVRLDGAGVGNATSNQPLAGDGMAVVRLPEQCSAAGFGPGTSILAVGTPTDAGILDAVEVTPSA